MNTVQRPSFTAPAPTPTTNAGTPVSSTDPRFNELVEQRRTRPEIGAIWDRQAKTTGMNYLKLRLRLSRSKLLELLAATPDTTNPDDIPVTEFVAFPNTRQENNSKRPSFRIYEAKE